MRFHLHNSDVSIYARSARLFIVAAREIVECKQTLHPPLRSEGLAETNLFLR